MKKVLLYISGLFTFTFLSCDKIDNPIVVKNTVAGSTFIKNSNKSVSNFKKTLLEDFTGHRCLNCPDAASIIKNQLLPVYGNSLVVISAHQGDLARPLGASFPNDYRTTAGETWGGSGGFGLFNDWPTGLINRKNYNSLGVKLGRSNWTSIVPIAMNDPFVLKLDIDTEYDPNARALNVYVKGTFKTAYTNKTNLTVVYLQDSLVGRQVDGSKEVDDYEFEHMLRGDINGVWGTEFSNAAVLANDSAKWSIKGFPLPSQTEKGVKGLAINDKKVTVVVFAYDAVTREVLQVEKVKIR